MSYGHADPRDAGIAKALTLDEARRNIAKFPALLDDTELYIPIPRFRQSEMILAS